VKLNAVVELQHREHRGRSAELIAAHVELTVARLVMPRLLTRCWTSAVIVSSASSSVVTTSA